MRYEARRGAEFLQVLRKIWTEDDVVEESARDSVGEPVPVSA
jgi:hypothetical protein